MSPQLKSLTTLAVVFLLLQLPIQLIQGVTRERRATRDEAAQRVHTSWGGPQSIVGPRLIVPLDDGESTEVATFLPTNVTVEATLETDRLRRGLFEFPVYRGHFVIRGSFSRWERSELAERVSPDAWAEAELVLELLHIRAIGPDARLRWGGDVVELRPASSFLPGSTPGVYGSVGADGTSDIDFEITFSAQGSERLLVSPHAGQADVTVQGDWSAPSFTGSWLPTDRSVDAGGFRASWHIPALGRGLPMEWVASAPPFRDPAIDGFGVELITPVDPYRMAERSTKYASLFLVLTFGALWLFSILSSLSVHPMHYVLIGGAIALFYLLELSLSEHLGFVPAYVLATVTISSLIGAYAKVVLRAAARGAVLGGSVAGTYGFLLLTLRLEDYALLAGSLALLALLSGVMFATRRVDWYAMDAGTARS
ncbi:MAG: cell envelope integrity protein CreD [Gemmatimonadota bacterium]